MLMKRMAAAERYWIMKGTDKLNQSIYVRDSKIFLDSEWKSGNVLPWGRGCTFVFTGNKKLWILSKLIKIRFDQG